MAIYSCNLASIGRTTHAAGTAGAHVRYIAREDASPTLLYEHMPEDPVRARAWMDAQERNDRKNARVIDKVRIALPRELSPEQRSELVRAYATELTGGRVPWMAALHQSGKDAANPHVHLILRDRDITTGKRVMRLSDSAREREAAGLPPKAVDHVRERWEAVCNAALERAGVDARIDRRSLEAQGIDREPTIHIGPRASHVEKNVQRPSSKDAPERAWWRKPYRDKTPYQAIDAGRTRKERHAEIIDLNLERAARSPHMETRARAKWEKEQLALDRRLEKELTAAESVRTRERRAVRGEAKRALDAVRKEAKADRREVLLAVREQYAPALSDLRARQVQDFKALKDRQSTVWARALLLLDFTGTARKRQADARRALSAVYAKDRSQIFADRKAARAEGLAAVRQKHEPKRQEIISQRGAKLEALRVSHAPALQLEDRRRQRREAEREASRIQLETNLQRVKKHVQSAQMSQQKDRERGPGLSR